MEWDGVILIQTGVGTMAGVILIMEVIMDGVILITDTARGTVLIMIHGTVHAVTVMGITTGIHLTTDQVHIMVPEDHCTEQTEVQSATRGVQPTAREIQAMLLMEGT
jgi:hypothetical protein